jgi:peptidoglycan hydrolase-like protein with peptidoglycan-binding domain
MPRSRIRRWLAMLAVAAVGGGLSLLAPQAAQAATPVCLSYSVNQWVGLYEWHTLTTNSNTLDRACSLKQGNTGLGVIVLQEALKTCFQQNIQIDGQFGTNTKNALKNAQRQINSRYGTSISVDGEYGPQTASWWWDAKYFQSGGVIDGGSKICVEHLGWLY